MKRNATPGRINHIKVALCYGVKFCAPILATVMLFMGTCFAQAPVISYAGPQTYPTTVPINPLSPTNTGGPVPPKIAVIGSTPNGASSIAVDVAGNIYFTRYGAYQINKIPASGGAVVTIGNGFSYATGIAVDASGNVYVAESGHDDVKEIPAGGGAPIVLGSGFQYPEGIAIDASNNVYVSDLITHQVKKIPAGNGTTVVIAAGFQSPNSLAVDGAGNIFVVDGGNIIKKIAAGTGLVTTVATLTENIGEIAADASGNIYYADYNNSSIIKLPAVGGTGIQIASGLGSLGAVAVNASGTVYFSNDKQVDAVYKTGGYSVNPALPQGLAIDINSGVISGTPLIPGGPQTYTVSATNNSGTATTTVSIAVNALTKPVISYATPQVYTTGNAISPLSPVNTGGSAAPETPAVVIAPFNFSVIGVDKSGNIYTATPNGSGIQEYPAGGGNTITIASNIPGITEISGIVADAAGNIYFSSQREQRIMKIAAGTSTPVTVVSGVSYQSFLAIDAAGNFYYAGSGMIMKIPAGSSTPVLVATGFSYIIGVCADGQGNLYIADYISAQQITTIKKIPVGTSAPVTFATGISSGFTGIVADAAGNVFYSVYNMPTITEIPAGGGNNIAVGSGFVYPANVGVDAKGEIFVLDRQSKEYLLEKILISGYKISPALPAGLKFDTVTGVISGMPLVPTPATNYTVTAFNSAGSSTSVVNITVDTSNPLGFSYNSPQVYYPTVPITPLAPLNTNGAIPGTGVTTLGTLAVNINSMAVDASGSVYIVGANSTGVSKLTGNTFVTLGTGLMNPTGIAVDAAGNIFIADNGHGSIKELPAGKKQLIYISEAKDNNGDILPPNGIAVDAMDNLYLSTNYNGIYKIPAGSKTATYVGGAENTSIAVDAAGNVFSYEVDLSEIIELVGGSGTPVVVASGLSAVTGIAVDAYDNVFYAQGNTVIMELPVDGSPAFAVATGLSAAKSVALDNKRNIFTASSGSIIQEAAFGTYIITPALPSGLSLDHKTGIISGIPAALTPAANYTVIAYNAQGASSTIVNIAVSTPPKPNISYNTPQTFNVGMPVSINPVNTGGPVPPQLPVTFASGLSSLSIRGLAIDAQGNVYASFYGSAAISKYPPGGGTPTSVGSGLSEPAGLALDATGNLFIADYGNAVVKEILASNGSIVTYGTGFVKPQGVAVDASGNLYVSDGGKNAIFKIPAGGGTATQLVGGLNKPQGIGVDPSGNIYFANSGGGNIREVLAGTNTSIVFATGFKQPYSVFVDRTGNVFVTDMGDATVKRVPAGGGTPVVIAKAITLKGPIAVTSDAYTNLYIGDATAGSIYEINPGYYINPSLPAGLSIDQNTGIISGIPTVVSPKTNYSIAIRNSTGFSVGTVEITVNPYQQPVLSYTSPQVYAMNTTITPLAPTSSAVFPAGFTLNATTFASGLAGNEGVAADSAGNVYVAETTNNEVAKIAPGGALTPLGSGFTGPVNVALDAAKNVYVADYGNHAVKEITTGGTLLTLGSGFTNPVSLAVDNAGNVYVADYGFGIKKIPAGNGTPVNIASSAYNNATAVAVDGNGNVFFTMGGVYEMLASTGTVMQYANSLANSAGNIVIDANGNIYYSALLNSNSNRAVFEITAGSTVSNQLNYGSAGNNHNIYLAVNTAGVLYLSDQVSSTVTKCLPQGGYFVSQFLPPGLSISNGTGVISGTPTAALAATSYTVTAYNTGGSGAATLSIKTVASANSSLTNLEVSGGTLSPAFVTATKAYSITVPYITTAVTVTPTAGDGTAIIGVNGVTVASGVASAAIPLSVGANTISVNVVDNGGTTVSNYTITASRAGNPSLAGLAVNAGTLNPAFAPDAFNYTVTMPAGVSAINITPTLADTTGTISINQKAIATGTASPNIQLALGSNNITIVTETIDGLSATYTINAIRPSANANLRTLKPSVGTLSPVFATNTLNYTESVSNTQNSIKITPSVADATATVKVNGTDVTSGTASTGIALNVGANTINILVTAQDGTTTKTYTITVTRGSSANDNLSALKLSVGTLSPAFDAATLNYTESVPNTQNSIKETATVADAAATVKVNGTAVTSGTASTGIALNVGANTITTVVTALDGTTTKTYTITVTRAAGLVNIPDESLSVSQQSTSPTMEDDVVLVHQGLSPNGDGINDFLVIDGIQAYPDNKLSIMNRNGQLIFEAKGYDNASKVFDGHSNKTGQMQLPGTYFYQLEYTVKGAIKHKTGYLVLKY